MDLVAYINAHKSARDLAYTIYINTIFLACVPCFDKDDVRKILCPCQLSCICTMILRNQLH